MTAATARLTLADLVEATGGLLVGGTPISR